LVGLSSRCLLTLVLPPIFRKPIAATLWCRVAVFDDRHAKSCGIHPATFRRLMTVQPCSLRNWLAGISRIYLVRHAKHAKNNLHLDYIVIPSVSIPDLFTKRL
jgi:hypothetical protein